MEISSCHHYTPSISNITSTKVKYAPPANQTLKLHQFIFDRLFLLCLFHLFFYSLKGLFESNDTHFFGIQSIKSIKETCHILKEIHTQK